MADDSVLFTFAFLLLLMTLFITLRALDVVDILLVSILLYQMYRIIKGTVAFSIFIGFFPGLRELAGH